MAATIMPKPFLKQLKADFPNLTIKYGKKFAFRPPKTVIFSSTPEPNYTLLALHELGHALSGHFRYQTHIERLKLESEAWEAAQTLCRRYHIPYDEEFAESQLDTYRDWLHAKSLCPTCHLTRYQTPDGKYHCPICDTL
ncbi:hypothetical protein IJ096_00610 [Candidatus Saccharibacteria bacterium]|nr:hypothetical protein [Candidatus Saccharibacteria bacterium]